MTNRNTLLVLGLILFCSPIYPVDAASNRVTIRSHTLTATIESGELMKLVNNLTGSVLVNNTKGFVEPKIVSDGLKGEEWKCRLSEHRSGHATYLMSSSDGVKIKVFWGVDTGTGDILLRMRVTSGALISRFTFPVSGIDIDSHQAVLPSNFGDCEVIQAPQTGVFSSEDTSQMAVSLFLFEGKTNSWAITYNDKEELNKGFVLTASDKTADAEIVQKMEFGSKSFAVFPVRFQACKGSWHTLADRFARDWMVKKLEYAPISQQLPWVKGIRASVGFNNYDVMKPELLDDLSKKLVPSQTLLYTPVWRTNAMDFGYPDYTPSADFIKWCKHARELGFHVCAHFNSFGVNKGMTEYFDRFKPGMNPVFPGWGVKDPDTGFLMWSLDGGRSGHYYVSPCYKPWRDFYVQAVKPAIEAGADVIHLDESHSPMTCPVENRDILNIRLGDVALHQALKNAYPQVALQEEAYNDVNTRFSSFAQDTAAAKHNLVHYIFSKFVKFVTRPGADDLNAQRDGYERIGMKLPWGQYPLTDGVIEEMRAFQDYELDPALNASLLPNQKAAFSGKGKVKAFLENDGKVRGLTVYLADGTSRKFNTVYTGVNEYAGMSLPDWLIYDENRLIGLDPKTLYRLTPGSMPQDAFHVSSVPNDFSLIRGVAGVNKDYFIVEFTANGPVKAFVPAGITEVYINGEKPERQGNTVSFTAKGKTSFIAFGASEALTPGDINAMPWAVDGMANGQSTPYFLARGAGFFHHAGGRAHVVGVMPTKSPLHLVGSFGMDGHAKNGMVGRIIINGKTQIELDETKYPWVTKDFNVDISSFAGQKVMIQLETDGTGGYNYGGWNSLRVE